MPRFSIGRTVHVYLPGFSKPFVGTVVGGPFRGGKDLGGSAPAGYSEVCNITLTVDSKERDPRDPGYRSGETFEGVHCCEELPEGMTIPHDGPDMIAVLPPKVDGELMTNDRAATATAEA